MLVLVDGLWDSCWRVDLAYLGCQLGAFGTPTVVVTLCNEPLVWGFRDAEHILGIRVRARV